MDIFKTILKERKLQGISWDKLSEGLPIQGNSLRVAFERGSVDETYIEHIKNILKIQNKNTNHTQILNEETEPYNIEVKHIDGLTSSIMQVPLVNQYAYAGYLGGYGDEEYLESLPKIPFILDKEYKGQYLAFEVKGDSMECDTDESIPEGSILLCRNVKQEYWSSKLHINKWDFVIVHKELGVVVKRIINHDVKSGNLTLHSLNDFYNDFVVNLNDIKQIFNIVEVQQKRKRR